MSRGSLTRVCGRIIDLGAILAGLSALAVVAAFLVPDTQLALGLVGVASVLMSTLVLAWISGRLSLWRARRRMALVHEVVGNDLLAAVLTDPVGEVLFCNDAAAARFGPMAGGTLAALLKGTVAHPAPILFRLQSKAELARAAREDIVTRAGHLRVAVQRLGVSGFLWRIEDIQDKSGEGRSNRAGNSLELAMLTIGRAGAVLSMNEAARRLIGERVKSLDRLCTDLPLRQGHIHRISTQTGQVPCLIIENEPSGGRRELYLFPMPAGTSVNGAAGTDLNEGWRFFDALPVPLLKLDPSGEVLMSNRPARDLLGMRDGTPRRLSDLMEGLGRSIGDWLTQASAGRAGPHSEFLRLTRADSEVFVQVTLSKVHDRGQPALIAVLSDATELKTLEAQFVQSQKMQAIGELAGGVAHDFNNLLTAISGHCDLLLLRHDQGDPDYGDLVQIHQNANRAAALVGQLLAFSRKQTLRPEVLDLRDTLSDLTHLLNRLVGEKITLTLTHVPVQQAIRADKRQLEQVLMNLVVNARDAMPGGGEIRKHLSGL